MSLDTALEAIKIESRGDDALLRLARLPSGTIRSSLRWTLPAWRLAAERYDIDPAFPASTEALLDGDPEQDLVIDCVRNIVAYDIECIYGDGEWPIEWVDHIGLMRFNTGQVALATTSLSEMRDRDDWGNADSEWRALPLARWRSLHFTCDIADTHHRVQAFTADALTGTYPPETWTVPMGLVGESLRPLYDDSGLGYDDDDGEPTASITPSGVITVAPPTQMRTIVPPPPGDGERSTFWEWARSIQLGRSSPEDPEW